MTTAIATPTTTWQIDPAHTEVAFSVRHLMISNVKGTFDAPTGAVTWSPDAPEKIDLRVEIPVGTISTRNEPRDAHLRGADFFDAELHPVMTFVAHRIAGDVNSAFDLIGEMTIRGNTRPLTLHVTAEGRGDDPWGNERLGFSAVGELNRLEFGLHYNQLLETGGVAVGERVKLVVNTEVMRPKQ